MRLSSTLAGADGVGWAGEWNTEQVKGGEQRTRVNLVHVNQCLDVADQLYLDCGAAGGGRGSASQWTYAGSTEQAERQLAMWY